MSFSWLLKSGLGFEPSTLWLEDDRSTPQPHRDQTFQWNFIRIAPNHSLHYLKALCIEDGDFKNYREIHSSHSMCCDSHCAYVHTHTHTHTHICRTFGFPWVTAAAAQLNQRTSHWLNQKSTDSHDRMKSRYRATCETSRSADVHSNNTRQKSQGDALVYLLSPALSSTYGNMTSKGRCLLSVHIIWVNNKMWSLEISLQNTCLQTEHLTEAFSKSCAAV